jgi:hypothetical protein
VCVLVVCASPVFAGFAPRIAVTSDAGGVTTIQYRQAASDDAAATLRVFVPAGFITSIGAHREGDRLGTVTAKVAVLDQGGTQVTASGTVSAALATTVGATGQPLSSAAAACTGVAVHDEYWLLTLTAAGQQLQIPVIVDAVLLGRTYSDFAGYILTLCLPAPDLPAGSPARAPLGTKLLEATLRLDDVFSVPPAWYIWRLLATPYTPTTGKANPAGAVETHSQDRTPQHLTLLGRPAGTSRVRLSGQLTSGGKGLSGQTIRILAGKKVVATTKTRAGGRYTTTAKLPTRTATLTATTTVADRDLGGCQQAAFAPLPCMGITIGGFTATSASVRVRT